LTGNQPTTRAASASLNFNGIKGTNNTSSTHFRSVSLEN